ncbi:S41 family peptidase [Candidatus Peregrinibacteria bacterium]|jgi:carboxyl-terminal processing protease|nr:S41 family peptidase [Candidatus Peregrinibacteria bacterium]MBT7736404.1 S41 family peptidase [Candidatus Peregrinibacteria bacterium]
MHYYHKSHKWHISLIVAVVAFVLGWQATALGILSNEYAGDLSHEDGVQIESEDIDLGMFWKVWSKLEEKYVDLEHVDEEQMVYGAIKGMVESLDDSYTVYMTPEESEEFSASLEGTLEGIGAELTVENNDLVVVSPLRNSPAEKAGLLPGDVIYMIEEEFANDMTLFDAIMNIRGEKGTTVTLTILREGLSEPFDVSIVRDSIDIESVTIEELDGEIVYLSVNQFNDKTNDEFSKAISEMILDEPEGIIVDLRFNGGGYLDIAVELLSYLLPSDTEAVVIKQRGKDDDVMNTNGNPKVLNVPLVVLVNGGSASASEILAGAIQDHKRGVIMGTQSFGKGTVQEVISFSDGSSMRMTIAKWFTPDGRDINKVGLTPDIVIEIDNADFDSEYDEQKEEAADYLREL